MVANFYCVIVNNIDRHITDLQPAILFETCNEWCRKGGPNRSLLYNIVHLDKLLVFLGRFCCFNSDLSSFTLKIIWRIYLFIEWVGSIWGEIIRMYFVNNYYGK